jgi:exodeoxyribonuclease VII small subunit
MPEENKKSRPSEMSFEQALEKLEKTVEKMEAGNLPLDKMIECFETGSGLAAFCREKLNSLEKKIELLVKDDGNKGVWSKFETDTAVNAEKSEPNDTDELF